MGYADMKYELFHTNVQSGLSRIAVLLSLTACIHLSCFAVSAVATEGMHFDGSGRETPWSNCTLCHGADLQGGVGPACTECHQDFSDPDPPPTGHHFPGRDDPITNNCTACHGADLMGDIGPSCYSCHDQLWEGGGGGNSPPVVDAGGPYSGVPGVAVEFDASGTTDADGDLLIYLWSFGDGSQPPFPSDSPTISHVYENAGTYTAVLSVTDGVNAPVIEQVQVVIENGTTNLPPVVDPGDEYSGIAQQPIQFDGSGTTDPEGDALEYSWDFGDGNQSSPSASPLASHTYAAAGTYTAILSVSDGFNPPVSESVGVNVAPPNTPPVADPGGPYSGTAGTPLQLDGSGSFDADGDTLVFMWDFGDGSAPAMDAIASHTYANAGTYTAELTVSDGVNDPVTEQVTVEISDDTTPPPSGDLWEVRLPLLGTDGTISFDQFAGFLFVDEDFGSCGQAFGIGCEVSGYTFWMDSKGALFLGSRNGDAMMGLVFSFMGNTNTIWFAEQLSAPQDPLGLFGGMFDGLF